MLNLNLPSVVLREAWSTSPLDTIRDTVLRTIEELEHLVDEEDDVQQQLCADPAEAIARRMALQLCTLELMSEVGLQSPTDSAPSESAHSGPDWARQYLGAIERYRIRAATSLGAALGVGPRAARTHD